MLAAIQMAEHNKTPFGAALAMGDQVFATAVSTAEEMREPSTHAVTKIIRRLSEQTGKKNLSGFTLYSTSQPCSDCIKEILAYNIKTVVYGCEIPDAKKYVDEFQNIDEDGAMENWNDFDLINGFLKEECETLLRKFS